MICFRHTREMIQKLESAGLGYHVSADETEDKLGNVWWWTNNVVATSVYVLMYKCFGSYLLKKCYFICSSANCFLSYDMRVHNFAGACQKKYAHRRNQNFKAVFFLGKANSYVFILTKVVNRKEMIATVSYFIKTFNFSNFSCWSLTAFNVSTLPWTKRNPMT